MQNLAGITNERTARVRSAASKQIYSKWVSAVCLGEYASFYLTPWKLVAKIQLSLCSLNPKVPPLPLTLALCRLNSTGRSDVYEYKVKEKQTYLLRWLTVGFSTEDIYIWQSLPSLTGSLKRPKYQILTAEPWVFISAVLIFTVIFCPQTSSFGSQHSSFVKYGQGGTSEKDHFYSKMTGAGLPSHAVTDRKPFCTFLSWVTPRTSF